MTANSPLARHDRPGIAAGCFGADGYGLDFPTQRLAGYAAVTLKTATRRPRAGNPGKVIHHGPDYTLNAVGLRNPGIDHVLSHILPRWQLHDIPVGVSVWGETAVEYQALALQATRAGADYIELNLSCVNADTQPLETDAIQRIASQCATPVYAKIGLSHGPQPESDDIALAANLTQITELAGVIMGNTCRIATHGELDNPWGGLSGPRLRHAHLVWIRAVAPNAAIPIIAAGGIDSPDRLAEYLQTGASGGQVGAALLRPNSDPQRSAHAW